MVFLFYFGKKGPFSAKMEPFLSDSEGGPLAPGGPVHHCVWPSFVPLLDKILKNTGTFCPQDTTFNQIQ